MSGKTYPLVSAQCSTLCRKLTRSSAATKVKELMERSNSRSSITNRNAQSMTDSSTNTTHNNQLYDAYIEQVESWEAICRFQTTRAHQLHENHHNNAEARFRVLSQLESKVENALFQAKLSCK